MLSWKEITAALRRSRLLLAERGHAPDPAIRFTITPRSDEAAAGARRTLFIALRGTVSDGNRFLAPLAQQGVGAFLSDAPPQEDLPEGTCLLVVSHARQAWSVLCAAAAGNPQDRLSLWGVTGTNGKSSTVWMARELLEQVGIQALTVGTLGARWGQHEETTSHTSPDPDAFFPLLARFVAAGGRVAVVEVSSHSLIQGKFFPLTFAGGAWTSFSRDHLDFHGSMEAYWQAKMELPRSLPSRSPFFVQAALSDRVAEAAPAAHVVAYGGDDPPSIEIAGDGATVTLRDTAGQGQDFTGPLPYVGVHNRSNFLAAWLIAREIAGFPIGPEHWRHLRPVPGRLEPVAPGSGGPRVYVDYAHTPDALKVALAAAREDARDGRVWAVCGCGGDRDTGKRPEMARAALTGADRAIFTSDNPRSEDPDDILRDMIRGLPGDQGWELCRDRKAAIELAIATAAPEDTVLIAGKGHETVQIVGTERVPFDDRAVAARELKRRRGMEANHGQLG